MATSNLLSFSIIAVLLPLLEFYLNGIMQTLSFVPGFSHLAQLFCNPSLFWSIGRLFLFIAEDSVDATCLSAHQVIGVGMVSLVSVSSGVPHSVPGSALCLRGVQYHRAEQRNGILMNKELDGPEGRWDPGGLVTACGSWATLTTHWLL